MDREAEEDGINDTKNFPMEINTKDHQSYELKLRRAGKEAVGKSKSLANDTSMHDLRCKDMQQTKRPRFRVSESDAVSEDRS